MITISDQAYFSRSATWIQAGDHVMVHDSFSPKAPRMITMEPWHQTVFMAADGEHTIGQFVDHMGAQYEGGTPAGLREQIHGLIAVLLDEGIIRLHSEAKPLPPYFATDAFKKDSQVTAAQMRADGLIK